MSHYKIINETHIRRMSDGAVIPIDEENGDYQEFFAWQQQGNKPLPPDPTPELEFSVPTRLTPEEKLRRTGLTVEDLKALIAEPVRELLADELHDTAVPPAIDQA